jgi:hypothetical protein
MTNILNSSVEMASISWAGIEHTCVIVRMKRNKYLGINSHQTNLNR